MGKILILAVFLLIAWLILRFAFALAAGALHILWIIAVILFILWIIGKIRGK
jgi:hypothetical protein